MPSEILEPVFHRIFIWHLIGGGGGGGGEDPWDEIPSSIICQMKALMKTRPVCFQADRPSVSVKLCPGWINPLNGVTEKFLFAICFLS